MCGTQTSAVCLSGCVGLRQVLCVCLDVWDSHKCCVFVWMRGTQTSAVCLFCLFTVSVPSPGCVGLGHVLFCVFVWMCGTQTSAVCLSGFVGLGQVLCVFLDVWDSERCCVFVWMCGT